MKLVFATNNQNKLKEIATIFRSLNCSSFDILTMNDIGLSDLFIDETETTIEGNAELKATVVSKLTGLPSFADDTGLEIDALDGKPGVYSSHFAGANCDDAENRKLVLEMLKDTPDELRRARFRTIIAFVEGQVLHLFEGLCSGKITFEEKGKNGFGYDSIFIPDGYSVTFAEMEPDLKNQISHRRLAFVNFVNFLLSR